MAGPHVGDATEAGNPSEREAVRGAMCPLKSPGHKRQADGCAERRRGSATDEATAALGLLRRHQPGGGVQVLGKVRRSDNWLVDLEFRVGPIIDRR